MTLGWDSRGLTIPQLRCQCESSLVTVTRARTAQVVRATHCYGQEPSRSLVITQWTCQQVLHQTQQVTIIAFRKREIYWNLWSKWIKKKTIFYWVMEKFSGLSISAESLALLRKYRSLGVVWGIFTLCHNIILWVVISQVRQSQYLRWTQSGTKNPYCLGHIHCKGLHGQWSPRLQFSV